MKPGKFHRRNNFCATLGEFLRVDKQTGKVKEDGNNRLRCDECQALDEDPTKRACAHKAIEESLIQFHKDRFGCPSDPEKKQEEYEKQLIWQSNRGVELQQLKEY